jgi:hypothetical protein
MPTFVLECGSCGHIDEFWFDLSGGDRRASCPECGDKFSVDGNRRYDLEGINISGDTVAGGFNFSGYYDEGLGEYVSGRRHRRYLMDKHGLEEYSPDPTYKKYRDEARYIRENAPAGDPDAKAAARKVLKTAADKRREAQVNETFKKAKI